MQTKVFEVVARVDHHNQAVTEHSGKAVCELGSADATGQRHNSSVRRTHLNKSFSFGRTRSATEPSPVSVTPRTRTIGRPSSACPIINEAADASSSAHPT